MTHRSVTRGAERLRHALLGAGQHVTAGAHGSSDQNRLAGQLQRKNKSFLEYQCINKSIQYLVHMLNHLIVDRYEWMVRRERSCRSLSVQEKRLLFAVHHVLFHLGDVVRDVVDDVHVQIVWCGVEDFGEGLQ